MANDEFQMGRSKIFIKAPESLFLLEERREKKFDFYARILQKAFQKYFNEQKFLREKEEAAGMEEHSLTFYIDNFRSNCLFTDIFYQRKERRQNSLNRNFYADYIGLDEKPSLKTLVGKREKVEFSQTVTRYDKKFKVRE
jgi:myosin-1